MSGISRTALAIALMGGLAACGSADNQANETAANEISAEAPNPFADAEQQMNQAMMSAVGSDIGDNWAKKMIAHHEGAIAMSEIVLAQNPTAEVGEMARMTIEKQRKDIEDITKLLKDGPPNQQAAELYRPAMMDMQQKMQAATGANPSESFMRKMVEHHKGAVAMSDVALQNGVSGAVREQAQKTRDANEKDAKMVEAMLGGATMDHAMRESGAKSAEQVKAEPAPADKPAAKAAPKSASKPPPAPKPVAEPAAGAPCLPEHRAAGHC